MTSDGETPVLLTSHVWRQDHNGFSHQDPSFIDHVANQKAEIVRIYLPSDASCLLAVAEHCLRSRNCINVIIAGKQPAPQRLDMAQAAAPLRRRCGRLAIWHTHAGGPLLLTSPLPLLSHCSQMLRWLTRLDSAAAFSRRSL